MPLALDQGRKTTFVPLLFFFSSGAAALVYQVVWVRQLLLLAGTTTAAVSTVLAVFMAGLGLGAWIFGGRADRSASPLRLYAYLELGIALYALVLPKLLAASTPVYVEIARGLVGRPWPLLLLRLGLGLLLLITPTVLMGGTLPLLVRHVGRDSEGVGLDLGTLYTANLAGGVVGSLAAGFVLIRWLGVEGATMVAVLANLVIGSAALVWSGLGGASPAAPETASPTGTRLALPAGARPVVWAVVLLSGVLTMAYEVLWTRILVLSFTSTVYAFTLILATFLTGLALGSRLLVVVDRRFDLLRALAAAQILGGLASLLCTPLSTRLIELIDGMADRFGHGGGVFLAAIALSAGLVMLIPAAFMGLVLPLGMRLLVDDLARAGRQVGAAYLTNTVGSVVGSLLGGFVLIPLLGLKGTLLCLASVQVALGWAVIFRSRIETRRRVQFLAVSACLLLAALAGVSSLLQGPSPFDRRLPRGGGPPPRF
jgi:spermidine synthase